jgi:hypothetical protein
MRRSRKLNGMLILVVGGQLHLYMRPADLCRQFHREHHQTSPLRPADRLLVLLCTPAVIAFEIFDRTKRRAPPFPRRGSTSKGTSGPWVHLHLSGTYAVASVRPVQWNVTSEEEGVHGCHGGPRCMEKRSQARLNPCLANLQQVLKVNILLVGLIAQTVFTVYLRARLVEMATHGQVGRVSWQSCSFTRIRLLPLHVRDQGSLQNHDTPEDAPDSQDAFESVDLRGSD